MSFRTPFRSVIFLIMTLAAGCAIPADSAAQHTNSPGATLATVEKPALAEIDSGEIRKMLISAYSQTRTVTGYTQRYFSIPYPGGDVPEHTGACTDVIVRSFRAAGIDLQREIHEDMSANFAEYPQKWGLNGPDTNIDHRRVPNLQTYFMRKGKSLRITEAGKSYEPGDVVAWDLNGKGVTHIGVVSNRWNKRKGRYLIIHNIGRGTRLEDRLFDWKIIGHYRYF